jgi:hypothetical protein
MTEGEWLACTDPQMMLEHLRAEASDRKHRLFACACCRRIWELLQGEGRRAVAAAEGHADGLVAADERGEAGTAARRPVDDFYEAANLGGHGVVLTGGLAAAEAAGACCTAPAALSCERAARLAALAFGHPAEGILPLGSPAGGVAQCRLLRDLSGNPFRPVTVSPSWQTPPVVALAHAAYDQREMPAGALDTARLAVLADALEEAGCTNADILHHLRGPGPHVRGCWAVDLLLGKS